MLGCAVTSKALEVRIHRRCQADVQVESYSTSVRLSLSLHFTLMGTGYSAMIQSSGHCDHVEVKILISCRLASR